MNNKIEVNVVIASHAPEEQSTIHRVVIAQDDNATLNENLAALRKMWRAIEADLAARGLI